MPDVAPRRAVRIAGLGLASALGCGLEAARSGLRAPAPTPRAWRLDLLDEPLTVPVFTLPGTDSLGDLSGAVALVGEVVREALAAAGVPAGEASRLPLFIGTSAFSLDRDAIDPDADAVPSPVGVQPVLAHRQIVALVERTLGGVGDTIAFQTACTSSANALLSAARMIEQGRYARALVVGVEIANAATMAGFAGLQLLAPSIHPFDRDRSGIVIGEGIGAAVLQAVADDGPGLFLRGGGTCIDTYRVTTSHPDGSPATALQARVLARAGVAPHAVRGVKAHGTGSPVNDEAEAAMLRAAFAAPPPVCALKGYVGHTLGACGITELALMGAALEAGFLPATPGFRTPDAALGVSPTREAQAAPDGHYALNFFGFGGHNTILLLERRA